MNVGRNEHTATLLPNGNVLLVAGSTDAEGLASAELFNPTSNTFSLTGSLSQARKSHTATLLQDAARVLVAGGKTSSHDTRSAEIYDIPTGQFRDVGSMSTSRSLFTATLLNNGKVLVAAGRHGGTPTPKAELFDPVTETFSDTGPMRLHRKRHRAVLLQDGTVLVSGGAALSNDDQPNEGTPTAETYDPATGRFTKTSDMSVGRTEHEATLLPMEPSCRAVAEPFRPQPMFIKTRTTIFHHQRTTHPGTLSAQSSASCRILPGVR